jgi:hypothetical protein
MADTFYLKRGDTSPMMKYTLIPKTNLTGAVVVFNMTYKTGLEVVVRQQAEVIGPPEDGVVGYEWAATDSENVGEHSAEFEVTYVDGKVETFPNSDYIRVLVTSDLG